MGSCNDDDGNINNVAQHQSLGAPYIMVAMALYLECALIMIIRDR